MLAYQPFDNVPPMYNPGRRSWCGGVRLILAGVIVSGVPLGTSFVAPAALAQGTGGAVPPTGTGANDDFFHAAVARAAALSTLTQDAAEPFHIKLIAQDNAKPTPGHNAEIEIWWTAPDKWRREVRSDAFTQTAIQNGSRYYESSTPKDYLPFWLHELIQAATAPIRPEDFASVSADQDRPGCGNWESHHGAGDEQFSSYNSVCFGGGTVSHIFASPLGLEFWDYKKFGGYLFPSTIKVFPGGRDEVTATVVVLEPLQKAYRGLTHAEIDALFDMPDAAKATSYDARLRFVSVPGSALEAADSPVRAPLVWPSSFVFPVNGVIAVYAQIDREGNLRNLDGAISKNQAINQGALDQIKDWKFKPYLVEGVPVEVVTELEIPFHLKYEPLGANGKAFPEISFTERIKKYRTLSEIRSADSAPFRLDATILLADGTTGTYVEVWRAPDDWSRQVDVGGVGLHVSQVHGASNSSLDRKTPYSDQMFAIMAAMQDRLPEARTMQEGDWGNSAVAVSNMNPTAGAGTGEPVLIRPARGAVDQNNHPTSGQAYWFDADGFLRASFDGTNVTAVNSDFVDWNGKKVARKIEVFTPKSTSGPLAVITVTSLKAN